MKIDQPIHKPTCNATVTAKASMHHDIMKPYKTNSYVLQNMTAMVLIPVGNPQEPIATTTLPHDALLPSSINTKTKITCKVNL